MKKLNLLLLVFITGVLSVVIISCSSDENEIKNSKTQTLTIENFDKNSNATLSYINEKHSINYKSELLDNKVNSTVNVFDKNTNELIQSTKFLVDMNLNSYKFGIFKKIEQISSDIKDTLKKNEWIAIKNSYENFVKKLLKNTENDIHKSNLIQSTFYHLSIFNTIVRSFEIKNCECTPMPAYFVGKSSFWCQEDYMFQKNIMQEYFLKNRNQLFEYENGNKVYDFVVNYDDNNKEIPFIDIFKIMYPVRDFRASVENSFNSNTLKKDREDCWLGLLGSDLGCCGNYSGCCWVKSLTCLLHDIECYTCDHWHCGWACEPGPVVEP